MHKHDFVYVTYIRSSAEKVWHALTDGEATRQYWSNHRNASDWQVGSGWEHQDYDNPAKVDVVGKVIESDPPRRLVISWSSPARVEDPEFTSRCTFDIVEDQGLVRLTVTHDQLDEGMARSISNGWPLVLSGLKSLLETGAPMPEVMVRKPEGGWTKTRFA